NQMSQAASAAGNSNLGLYLNEWNVLQFSPASINTSGAGSGSDPYANWYRKNIDDVRAAGGSGSGVGIQYYAQQSSGSNVHSAATIQKAMQNLSVPGLPITLSEFGLASGQTQANGANIMEDTMRM